mmetsp:Transcript_47857/g.55132  ORF Transcript_47857/g.55132 Transcript_47857/m.55132 type:complete len:216 (-) Transcript_47857:620-1267(-)
MFSKLHWPPMHPVPDFVKEEVIVNNASNICYWACNNQCQIGTLQRFLLSCKMVAPLMVPFHAIPLIMDIFKIWKKEKFWTELAIRFKRRFSNWIQQIFSTSLLALIYLGGTCFYRHYMQRAGVGMTIFSTVNACLAAGFAEASSRRKELALYFFAKWIRSFGNVLAKRDIILYFRHIELAAFTFAWALMAWLYQSQSKALAPIAKSILGFLFGVN